jgi:hypothetical protein
MTKASTQNLQTHSGNIDHYCCGELILRLLVAFSLWVFVMRHFLALFSMCHWFLSCSILLEIMLPSGRSPLYVTKSSDEGQIMLPSGRSPLYETKSSDEGQIMLTLLVEVHCTRQSPPTGANHVDLAGRSPLYETKSSNEGQIMLTLLVEVLLYETKSTNEGQIMLTLMVKVRCTRQSPPTRGKSC